MELHKSQKDFRAILTDVSAIGNIRTDVLEKDYYVTLLLKELSEKQTLLPIYFKGGTALYKALRCVKRFSEDIDLTVEIGDCATESAKKKRVEASAKNYTSLQAIDGIENKTGSRSVTRLYGYQSLFSLADDPLQRFGRVKIEATSFTKSEPHEYTEIAPVIYDLTDEAKKKILRDKFGVIPFGVATIKLERIFVDKIFAAEFYYSIQSERNLFDVSKHIYDIAVMSALPQIKALFSDEAALRYLVALKREEETARRNSNLNDKPFKDFKVFEMLKIDAEILSEYNKMQRIYVFNIHDVIEVYELCKALDELWQKIKRLQF
jgi:hypothetical protein